MTAAVEQKVSELTNEYYQTLPYDFGMKRPPGIDHLLRVKEKVR